MKHPNEREIEIFDCYTNLKTFFWLMIRLIQLLHRILNDDLDIISIFKEVFITDE